ncbi:hypothetical protein SBA6_470054 [Candidatus Sulfopaludibacter sp. SbA6]|nr:hypothetical protein SBA6_470054 [Candidatus Sulfopaludibacter sp. SbA6]
MAGFYRLTFAPFSARGAIQAQSAGGGWQIQGLQPVWGSLRSRLSALEELGVVERIGRGRGVRYLPSQKFYSEIGRAGAHTREKGLDRQTNLALLLRHVGENAVSGARLQDLLDVLRHLSRDQVQGLLRELKDAGRIHPKGTTKAGRWFPGRGD